MSFETLGLSAELLRAIAEQGYTEPTPVQAQAIPLVLEGRDIRAGAQTGTGKTASFTLPLLQRLSARASSSTSPAMHPIRALILTPTRELAAQVAESVQNYGKYLPLKSAVVFGGVNMNAQIKELQGGVDVLVATPGRLLDHVEQRTVNLSRVEMFVLDEADRMLDMGFMPDIKRVITLMSPQRQNLMFSATYSDEIKKLAEQLLQNPAMVEVARRNTASEMVKQVVYHVEKDRKRELLSHLIKTHDLQQVLVFTRTKHGADRLTTQLEKDGIAAVAIHGDKAQSQRTKALEDFKQGTVKVMVATDIAARGLDIDQLPHVVNYELPHVPEDYVHRIGRTGRGGSSGDAISLVCEEEHKFLADIERVLNRSIDSEVIAGFEKGVAGAVAVVAEDSRSRDNRSRDGRSRTPRENKVESKPREQRSTRSTLSGDRTIDPMAQYVARPVSQPAPDYTAPQRNTKQKQIAALFLPPKVPQE
ncbi:DEAD/DEAH box helicase [Sulfurirhabdus autotrophica]|uniref:DEAD-box ATP-dependent RNA helicase RhpA n=1 Tax=Sulfurirhabdus autotrophica TaxID=1706046 RepID=A0A4R3XSS8_9PROT|nr:DEAD/DEAH box helicase [Sulfurirhabdus autotrophica]TCV81108.1 ATP-dependent RNA helicase RhlE [Sulfurirhabdus autotrophica]